MRSKYLMTRCLAAMATMIIVATVATAAEQTASTSPPAAAIKQEKPGGQVDPHAREILLRACKALTESEAFTFHAEITFDQVMPSQVKL